MSKTKRYKSEDVEPFGDLEDLFTPEEEEPVELTDEDIENRRLYIDSDITKDVALKIVRAIIQYNTGDKDKPKEERLPIKIYISTLGGDVAAGLSIIDAIKTSKTPIMTINQSTCYSMGFLIFIAGDSRIAMPRSTFLIHDGIAGIENVTTKVQDWIKFNEREEVRLRKYISDSTKISMEILEDRKREEWYMFADEAKDLGVVDYILGYDCDMDFVI